MEKVDVIPLHIDDENATLRNILEGTATSTGKHFFKALVENLAKALGTHSAWVTEYLEKSRQLRALAFWSNGSFTEDFLIDIDGTPCEKVIESNELIHYPDNVIRLYPQNATFKEFKAVSYMGIPLLDKQNRVMGNLAVFDTRPMPKEANVLAIFKIFAARASAELQRLRAEMIVRKSEEKYRRIIETTGEGFILMDKDLIISDANDAFCRMIGYENAQVIGRSPVEFATEDFRQFLKANKAELFADQYKEFEGTILTKAGRKVPIRVYGNILKDDKGTIIGYMNFVSDLTQQKSSLALAAEVQKNLLPQSNPKINGFDIAGKTISCDEIGGDYFDFLSESNDLEERLKIVVGDVTGHGVEAALLMTTARAFFRMQASHEGNIAEIINAMNRHLAHDVLDTGRFMTLFCLQLDAYSRQIHWIRAGHAPALIYTPENDHFEELKGEGLALGVDDAFKYHSYLAPDISVGQVIAIGTDGIWEAFNLQGEQYGMKRFRNVIRKNAKQDAPALVDTVYDDLKRFTYGNKQEDDISLVIMKVTESAPIITDWSI